MKFAKIITAKTFENNKGLAMKFVTTVSDKATPEQVFASMGLLGQIESYTVTPTMPLAVALKHSLQLQRKMGLIR